MEEVNNSQNKFTNFSFNLRHLQRRLKKSLWLPFILVGIVVLAIVVFSLSKLSSTPSTLAGNEVDTSVAEPTAEQSLKKDFSFPLKDSTGKEVSKVKYTIEKAELLDEIIVKGQRAYAVEGRSFLILNIKVTNDFNQAIQINAKDYIRLVVNGSKEKLAADIHNDPVDIQAISTKTTRLGFPIDDDFKSLALEVGEIEGAKQTLKLQLK